MIRVRGLLERLFDPTNDPRKTLAGRPPAEVFHESVGFHPSAAGQSDLAEATWEDGTFSLPEACRRAADRNRVRGPGERRAARIPQRDRRFVLAERLDTRST